MELEAYDKAFDTFLESKEYDSASRTIYSLASAAFKAGWKAAKGSIALPGRLFGKPNEDCKE
jgi:hypothetical protein